MSFVVFPFIASTNRMHASLLKALKIPMDHLKQYSNIFDVWIDHLTHGALVEMGEPTDMVLLYLSAIDKLVDNAYEDPNNVTDSVLWGYQRISGFVYDAMYKAMRAYAKAPQSKNASIDINPEKYGSQSFKIRRLHQLRNQTNSCN